MDRSGIGAYVELERQEQKKKLDEMSKKLEIVTNAIFELNRQLQPKKEPAKKQELKEETVFQNSLVNTYNGILELKKGTRIYLVKGKK